MSLAAIIVFSNWIKINVVKAAASSKPQQQLAIHAAPRGMSKLGSSLGDSRLWFQEYSRMWFLQMRFVLFCLSENREIHFSDIDVYYFFSVSMVINKTKKFPIMVSSK